VLDQQNNSNQVNTVINTMVIHNEKISILRNHLTNILNDYANASEINKMIHEVIARNKNSPPKPDRSWQELIIGPIMLGTIVCIADKVWSKCRWPCLFLGIKQNVGTKTMPSFPIVKINKRDMTISAIQMQEKIRQQIDEEITKRFRMLPHDG
jgi:hypothetical protein